MAPIPALARLPVFPVVSLCPWHRSPGPLPLIPIFLFHYVAEVFHMDFTSFPEPFLLMDSCLIVVPCGRIEAGGFCVTILIPESFGVMVDFEAIDVQ